MHRNHDCHKAHCYRAFTPSEIKGYRIFIVGSGVFGLSLHRYISSTSASDEVTAYDSNEKGAACDDTHKIVRIQYAMYDIILANIMCADAAPAWSMLTIPHPSHDAGLSTRVSGKPLQRIAVGRDVRNSK